MLKHLQLLLSGIFLLFTSGNISAQCMLSPVSLQQRVTQSSCIAQGRVTEQHCYIDAKSRSVNTLNRVEVNAWLKNNPGKNEVYLITEGGVLGNRATIVSPALQVDKEQEYVFFLQADDKHMGDTRFQAQHPEALQLTAYADGQGALSFWGDGYHDAFGNTPVQEAALFAKIAAFSGQQISYVAGRTTRPTQLSSGIIQRPLCPPGEFIYDPTETRAGTIVNADFITLYGELCWNLPWFTSTDPLSPWVQITVPSDILTNAFGDRMLKIPQNAGTGPTYEPYGGGYNGPITIDYSHLSVYSATSAFPEIMRQRYYLRNIDGSGGYTYQLSANLAANTAAKNAFSNAVNTWRCITGVNISVSPTPTAISAVAADGASVVMFDNSLPPGELSRTTTQLYSGTNAGCDHFNTVWYQTESDFQFNQAGISWQYGPGLPAVAEYDFESVALHEIGHGIGLAHTNNTTDVMFHTASAGTSRRTPYTNDLSGVAAKLAYSSTPTCFDPPGSGTAMTLSGCAALPVNISNLSGIRLDKTSNQLYWTTYQEQNNRGFAIQRSANTRDFATIDFVPGAINSSVTRNYIYKDLQAGEFPWYYRLLITATDGSTKTSSVAFVPGYRLSDWKVWLADRQSGIIVYRNPSVKETAHFQLYNTSGQLLSITGITATNTSIPVERYPAGVYYYRLVSASVSLSGKIVVN